MQSRHVSRIIAASPEAVYAVASRPDLLHRWAAGLASTEVVPDGDRLRVSSPMGEISIVFAPVNPYGVLDHEVRLPSGEVVHNPMRVVVHPDGAEVVFTVRQLAMTDAELDRDAGLVAADLDALAVLVERSGVGPVTAAPATT